MTSYDELNETRVMTLEEQYAAALTEWQESGEAEL